MTMQLETGCYVEGHWGQYGAARVIILAQELGWDDTEAIDLASRKLDSMGPSDSPELTFEEEEVLIGACDDAERYLNDNVAEPYHCFEWEDGEFFYTRYAIVGDSYDEQCAVCGSEVRKVEERYDTYWEDKEGDSLSYVPQLHDHRP